MWRFETSPRRAIPKGLPSSSAQHGKSRKSYLHRTPFLSFVAHGVLDWDLAQPFDQAVDVACLASQGWDLVAKAVDGMTYRRARIWSRIFGLEYVAAAIIRQAPSNVVQRRIEWTITWLERDEAHSN